MQKVNKLGYYKSEVNSFVAILELKAAQSFSLIKTAVC